MRAIITVQPTVPNKIYTPNRLISVDHCHCPPQSMRQAAAAGSLHWREVLQQALGVRRRAEMAFAGQDERCAAAEARHRRLGKTCGCNAYHQYYNQLVSGMHNVQLP